MVHCTDLEMLALVGKSTADRLLCILSTRKSLIKQRCSRISVSGRESTREFLRKGQFFTCSKNMLNAAFVWKTYLFIRPSTNT